MRMQAAPSLKREIAAWSSDLRVQLPRPGKVSGQPKPDLNVCREPTWTLTEYSRTKLSSTWVPKPF